jgi:hypothetical protein
MYANAQRASRRSMLVQLASVRVVTVVRAELVMSAKPAQASLAELYLRDPTDSTMWPLSTKELGSASR